jgi:hypothetical protein
MWNDCDYACGTLTPVTVTVTDCFPVMRVLLNDLNVNVPEFANATLQSAVAACLSLCQVPGYSLTPDQTQITPAFPGPKGFALVCFKSVRLLITGTPSKYGFRTRALSETFGSYRPAIMDLDKYIHDLVDGEMFSGWQSFYGFLSGISGLSLLEVFTEMRVDSPFYSITLTATGGTAAS